MSQTEAMFETIEKLYAISRVIHALQKKPHTFGGETLYANESHTLKMIADHDGISQTELSDRMLRTKGATSVIVGSLADRGLVTRTRVEGDQRRYILTLTEHGRNVNRAHLAFDETWAARANKELGLSESELRQLSDNLEKFIAYASKAYLDHGHVIADTPSCDSNS